MPIQGQYPMTSIFNNLPAPIFQDAVNQTQGNTQSPLGLALFGALASAAMCTQGLVDVELPSGAIVPTSLMLMVIAGSGERKSTVEKIFMKGIRDFELTQEEAYEKDLDEWRKSHKVWDVMRGAIQRKMHSKVSKGLSPEEEKAFLLDHLSVEPKQPVRFKLLYEDTTSQAIFLGLEKSWPSVGLISSEGAAVLNGSAFNDLPKQNAIWSGDPVTIDRVSAPSFRLTDARLTVSIQVQPSAIEQYMAGRGEKTRGSGLWARFMVCMPGSTQGSRFSSSGTTSWEHCSRFNKRVVEIMKINHELLMEGNYTRKVLKLSAQARVCWLDYYNWVESEIRQGGKYFEAGDHASKLAENAGRVAAVLHHFEGMEGDIGAEIMSAAIKICDTASSDFIDLFVPSSQEYRDCCLLDEYLSRLRVDGYSFVTKNRVRQYGPSRLREKDRLGAAINLLCQQGKISISKLNNTVTIHLFPHRWSVADRNNFLGYAMGGN